MSRSRSYLFLQGVCSPFFARLAARLKAEGHEIYKVNFNAGDWAYWQGRFACNYSGGLSELKAYFDNKYRHYGITDQVLFGDRRPVHRPAIDQAKICGVRTHVFEEGYFRPYWITLEREGVNGHSLLPRDPEWFRAVGSSLPDYGQGKPFQSSFMIRAAHDVAYHSAGVFNPLFFKNYQTHAQITAPYEYAGYAKRLPRLRFCKFRDDVVVKSLIHSATPFFLLPLQLGSDAQIRDHSRFDDMAGVIEYVMASFAQYAPDNARLVLKNHPLDTGLFDYPQLVNTLMDHFCLSGRIDYLETGDLEALLNHAQGTVTVNSTAGALSLALKCPTISLSDPIYNLPGLTFQGGLDDFWQARPVPNADLFSCFRNTVIHTTQVNGGFYSAAGIALAVENSVDRLVSERSPLESFL